MNKIIKEEIISNAMKLMRCITIKENYSEFYKAFSIIREELSNYYIKERVINGYPNLIISNTKSLKLDVIFCCHIDVVLSDSYEPILDGNILRGRGSFDMKGQLAVILSLFKNNVSKKKIALIVTSDEEIGGECCKRIIENYDAFCAVIPDAGRNFQLITEEKGLLQVELLVSGISSHASAPFKGNNAILKAIDIYNRLLEIYPMPVDENDFKTSICLSKLHGGDTGNKVCDSVTMFLDIRFSGEVNKKIILNDIKKVAEDSVVMVIDYGPMFHVDSSNPIIAEFLKNCKKILKRDVEISNYLATSDAIYFSEKNIPVILMNPNGDNCHHPDEYVEVDSLYVLYKLFKTLI